MRTTIKRNQQALSGTPRPRAPSRASLTSLIRVNPSCVRRGNQEAINDTHLADQGEPIGVAPRATCEEAGAAAKTLEARRVELARLLDEDALACGEWGRRGEHLHAASQTCATARRRCARLLGTCARSRQRHPPPPPPLPSSSSSGAPSVTFSGYGGVKRCVTIAPSEAIRGNQRQSRGTDEALTRH